MSLRRELGAAVTAAGTATVLHRGRPVALRRTAASGREVTLAEGPAVVAGLLAAQLPSPAGPRGAHHRGRGPAVGGSGHAEPGNGAHPDTRAQHATDAVTLAATLAVTLAAAAGLVDDLAEEVVSGTVGRDRGLRGHLAALRAGRVTTGAGKIVLIGSGALAAALVLAGERPAQSPVSRTPGWRTSGGRTSGGRTSGGRTPGWRTPGGLGGRAIRTVTDSVLIAGTANLLNLFDTRPGRAGKVALLGVAVLRAGARGHRAGAVLEEAAGGGRTRARGSGVEPTPGVAGIAGVLAGTMAGDLRGLWMLGDCGANALGAALGVRAAATAGPVLRAGWLVGVLVLTAASERVSFTAVIGRHPVLDALDRLGRR